MLHSWVYCRFYAADGNFKVDHVRQKKDSDVWLGEGGGMFAKREDYHAFLDTATEQSTVSSCKLAKVKILTTIDRKHPARTDFM